MPKVNDYLQDRDAAGQKAIHPEREAKIFAIIDEFTNDRAKYTTDNPSLIEDLYHGKLNIRQKRMIRNEIVKRMIEDDSNRTIDDKITDAFFKTKYGQRFDNDRNKTTWNNRKNTIFGFIDNNMTIDGDNGSSFFVSPYDPAFALSDYFNQSSDAVDTDKLMYVADADDDDFIISAQSVDLSSVRRNGHVQRHDADVELYATINGFNSEVSGYNTVARYLTDDTVRNNVQDFFERHFVSDIDDDDDETRRYFTDDERKFAIDCCNYLAEKGIPFELKVSSAGGENISAKLGYGREIVLVDAADPMRQGRVSDRNFISRIMVPGILYNDIKENPDIKNALSRVITSDMKMAAIRQYFGDDATFVNNGPRNSRTYDIGRNEISGDNARAIENVGEAFNSVSSTHMYTSSFVPPNAQTTVIPSFINTSANAKFRSNVLIGVSEGVNISRTQTGRIAKYLPTTKRTGQTSVLPVYFETLTNDTYANFMLPDKMTENQRGHFVRDLFVDTITETTEDGKEIRNFVLKEDSLYNFDDLPEDVKQYLLNIVFEDPNDTNVSITDTHKSIGDQLADGDIVLRNFSKDRKDGNRIGITARNNDYLDDHPEMNNVLNILYAESKMTEWISSAKEEFSHKVNIDHLIEEYKRCEESGQNVLTEYVFSADQNVAKLQRHYLEFLKGDIRSSGNNRNDFDSSDFDDNEEQVDKTGSIVGFSSSDLMSRKAKESIDDYVDRKRPLIEQNLQTYLTNECGDMRHLFDENDTTSSFNPNFVANYMQGEFSRGRMENMNTLLRCVSLLGDKYDRSMVKIEKGYDANNFDDRMLKYNEDASLFNIDIPISLLMNQSDDTISYDNLKKNLRNVDLSNYKDYKDVNRIVGAIRRNPAMIDDIVEVMKANPVRTEMLIHTAKSLNKQGCDWNSITLNMDNNGVISYAGYKHKYAFGGKSESSLVPITGEMGQVFEPDENGVIIPTYGGKEATRIIIPGYNAHIVPNDNDNPKTMLERLRLVGWKTLMKQAISEQVRYAANSDNEFYNTLAHGTELNGKVYRHMYDMRMSVDDYYLRLGKFDQLSDDVKAQLDDSVKPSEDEIITFKNVIATLKGRCRFPNEYSEFASTTADAMLMNQDRYESKMYNYYYSDLLDNNNIRVIGDFFSEFKGALCCTSTGTARNQGAVGYVITDNVDIDAVTGEVKVKNEFNPENPPVTPLMKDVMLQYREYNGWDREQMVFGQVLTALRTPRDVHAAYFNAKGYTFDDGYIASKDMADRYKIRGADGKFRSLTAQDKFGDDSGNKGIDHIFDGEQYSGKLLQMIKDPKDDRITLDTENSNVIYNYDGKTYTIAYDKEAKDLNQAAVDAIQKKFHVDDDICKIFWENNGRPREPWESKDLPDPKFRLDIIASPYSGLSRYNGGTVRGLMDNLAEDNGSIYINGEVKKGYIGKINMMILDMTADKKNHWYYDSEDAGSGRKASGQLLWALGAKDATEVIDTLYKDNNRPWDNLREYALAVGLDFTEQMEPVIGYHPHETLDEKRVLMDLPSDDDISKFTINKSNEVGINGRKGPSARKDVRDACVSRMNKNGGFMELPFPLKFDIDKYLSENAYKDIGSVDGEESRAMGEYAKDIQEALTLQETGYTWTCGDEERPTYGLPVLPPHLRSARGFEDGTSANHDYTDKYANIYEDAAKYMLIERKLAELEPGDSAIGVLAKQERDLVSHAQSQLNYITNDIVSRKFDTKHNLFRDGCMVAKNPQSATAVISADSRLKSDEVSMSRANAEGLGLVKKTKNGTALLTSPKVLLFRDPILHAGNVRYMNVVIDDTVQGIRINPAMDKSFDGDFDGDTYGIISLGPKNNESAWNAFSVTNNMLDRSVPRDKNGNYPIYINDGMDIASVLATEKPIGKETENMKKFKEVSERMETYFSNPKVNKRVFGTEEVSVKNINDYQHLVRELESKSQDPAVKDFINKNDMNTLKAVGKGYMDDISDGTHGLIAYREVLLEKANDIQRYYDSGRDIAAYKSITSPDKMGKTGLNADKVACKEMLDHFVQNAFNGIANDAIVFDSPEAVVKSFTQMVEHGAKGDMDKLHTLMDYIGIDMSRADEGVYSNITMQRPANFDKMKYQPDYEEGRAIPKKVYDGLISDHNESAAEAKRTQKLVAYKADGTAYGGVAAQKGIMALRDMATDKDGKPYEALRPVLESFEDTSYVNTQSLLQSKKGQTEEAVVKGTYHQFLIPDTWNGTYLSGGWHDRIKNAESKTPEQIWEEMQKIDPKELWTEPHEHDLREGNNGQSYPRKCTRTEFLCQMMGMARAVKVKINPDNLVRIANSMSYTDKNGITMFRGVKSQAEVSGSMLDKLSYGSNKMAELVKCAAKNTVTHLGDVPQVRECDVSDDKESDRSDHRQSLLGNLPSMAPVIYNNADMASKDGYKQNGIVAKTEKKNVSRSASFASMSVCRELQYVGSSDENRKLYEENNKGKKPTPIGSRDCRAPEAATKYMGPKGSGDLGSNGSGGMSRSDETQKLIEQGESQSENKSNKSAEIQDVFPSAIPK